LRESYEWSRQCPQRPAGCRSRTWLPSSIRISCRLDLRFARRPVRTTAAQSTWCLYVEWHGAIVRLLVFSCAVQANNIADETSKMATTFGASHMEFYNKLVWARLIDVYGC
jgi:hypothetical protein